MARRIGRDTSIIPLMLGPIGFGIPKWLGLVIVYYAGVLALGLSDKWALVNLSAAAGPGIIGLADLALRLRTTHYQWVNPAGGIITTPASIVDRLTLRECGWYFPLINLPLPLWLLGGALSAAFI